MKLNTLNISTVIEFKWVCVGVHVENILSASNDPQRTKTAACNRLLRETQGIFTNTVLSDK